MILELEELNFSNVKVREALTKCNNSICGESQFLVQIFAFTLKVSLKHYQEDWIILGMHLIAFNLKFNAARQSIAASTINSYLRVREIEKCRVRIENETEDFSVLPILAATCTRDNELLLAPTANQLQMHHRKALQAISSKA